jgi:hypothetical protein
MYHICYISFYNFLQPLSSNFQNPQSLTGTLILFISISLLMNPDPCGGDENENDSCGVIFPRMALDTVLCPLCKKLKVYCLTQEALVTLQVTLRGFLLACSN